MSPRPLTAFLFLLALAAPARAAETPSDFFEKKIRPVLVAECYSCHSADAKKIKGNLRLDTREGALKGGESGKPAIVPGDPDKSLLIQAIRQTNPDLAMPPKKELPGSVVQDFETWVRLGAPDPRTGAPTPAVTAKDPKNHWAFQPIRDPAIPSVNDTAWVRTPVDTFVLAQLERHHLKPSPPADKRTLIRRAYYDLWGLPPTFGEVQAFESDPSPDAFDKVVDRLLASPRYGERWGRYWLDLARYADTKGYVYGDREDARFVHSHNYRDWVLRAFNQDMPYDRFLIYQIAADRVVRPPSPKGARDASSPSGQTPVGEASGIGDRPRAGGGEGRTTTAADPRNLAAMGFLTLGRRFLGVIPDIIDDRIDTLTRTTQGLSVGCARCHDHKFDPIPTKDYYSLYGVFDASTERTVPLQSGVTNKTPEFLAYEAELKKRTDKLNEAFAKKKEEAADRARAHTAAYLVALLDVEKIPDELFYEFRDANSIYPAIVRQWQQYLFARSRHGQGGRIWGPWQVLSKLRAEDFSEQSTPLVRPRADQTNPLVTAALAATPLKSMRDVATAYGKLLQDADRRWKDHRKADPKASSLPDADWEQLRQVLYAPDAPVRVPEGSIVDVEFYFDEGTRVELAKLQKNIDAWHIEAPGATPQAVVLEDRPPRGNPRVFRRGNPATKGEEVPRQYLQVLSGPNRQPFRHGSGRLELAEAIASPTNPLTARVMVNRLWQWHFGQGLVKTPSDFGLRCDPPTHPDLLDHLATKFIQSGWSVKALHRMIMLSSTYQQGGESTSALPPSPGTPARPELVEGGEGRGEGLPSFSQNSPPAKADPENRLLSHFPLHRLDFESLRDSLLLASGDLDLTVGGRPVDLLKTKRRTVYARVDRQFLPGVLRTFDFANPDLHTPERPQTTVPQQALFMMNSPFVLNRARHLAARRDVAPLTDPAARIEKLYEIVHQRRPTPVELSAGVAYLSSAATDPAPEAPKPVSPAWQYGYGELDPATGTLKSFSKLPHFTGTAWQGGANWPDARLGWAQLTADGGHAGNDLQHAVVRRWVSPIDGQVSLSGPIAHTHPEGHGVTARILSSRHGQLASFRLHNRKATVTIDPVEVKKGDTIDFVASINESLNNNDFLWSPVIKPVGDKKTEWNAKKDFGGPPTPTAPPLTAWEKYAQVLLMSDEFVFVD